MLFKEIVSGKDVGVVCHYFEILICHIHLFHYYETCFFG
jgi:hypothetical protein